MEIFEPSDESDDGNESDTSYTPPRQSKRSSGTMLGKRKRDINARCTRQRKICVLKLPPVQQIGGQSFHQQASANDRHAAVEQDTRPAKQPRLLGNMSKQCSNYLTENQDDEEDVPQVGLRATEIKEEAARQQEHARTQQATPPAEEPNVRESTGELYGVTPERAIQPTADESTGSLATPHQGIEERAVSEPAVQTAISGGTTQGIERAISEPAVQTAGVEETSQIFLPEQSAPATVNIAAAGITADANEPPAPMPMGEPNGDPMDVDNDPTYLKQLAQARLDKQMEDSAARKQYADEMARIDALERMRGRGG